jgi:hypothetical protein
LTDFSSSFRFGSRTAPRTTANGITDLVTQQRCIAMHLRC